MTAGTELLGERTLVAQPRTSGEGAVPDTVSQEISRTQEAPPSARSKLGDAALATSAVTNGPNSAIFQNRCRVADESVARRAINAAAAAQSSE
jgi:hypothetical protein